MNIWLYVITFFILGSVWLFYFHKKTFETFKTFKSDGYPKTSDLPPTDWPWVSLNQSRPSIPPRSPLCLKAQQGSTHKDSQGKNYITYLPKGAGDYPPTLPGGNPRNPKDPPPLHGSLSAPQQEPPVWNWKSYMNYYYYDPWWAYSYPYNRRCDAFARRNCGGSWYPRDCYRQQYDRCVTENIY